MLFGVASEARQLDFVLRRGIGALTRPGVSRAFSLLLTVRLVAVHGWAE